MSLQLTPEIYKEFYGSNVDQMPKLLAESRVPLSMVGLLKAKLKYGKDFPAWRDYYFGTGDVIVYHPDGRIKIDTNSENLREINPKSQLIDGALVLDVGVYDTIQGQEFIRSEIEKYTERPLSKKEVKSNPLWKALVNDQNLLNEAVDFIFSETKNRFDDDRNMMGLYLDSASDFSKLRAWGVYWFGRMSNADGWSHLDEGRNRLVGVSTKD